MYGQYWSPQIVGNPYLPTMVIPQQVQQAPPVQNTIQVQQPKPVEQPILQQAWNWRIVKDYQSMLQESIPFDGTPVLFMMSDSSTFYIVNMVDGKKMVNGYEFLPLDNREEQSPQPILTPEEKTEQRLSNLENNINLITEQLGKLLGVKENESNTQITEPTEQVQRTSIKQ